MNGGRTSSRRSWYPDLAPLDVRLARAALLDALAATAVAGPLAMDGATSVEAAAAARAVPLAPGEAPGVGDLLLNAEVTLVLDGHRAAAPLVRRAITALRRDPSESAEMLDWLEAGCRLAGVLGYDAMMHTLGTRLEQQARRQGALPALATALIYSGTAEMFAGSLGGAQERFIERGAIESAREGDCSLGTLLVMAWRGQERATRSEAARVVQAARRQGDGWRLTWVEYAVCVLELGLGHYREALASTPSAFEANLLVSAFALPDFIEAAARSGHDAAAREALTRITDRVSPDGSPMTLGLLARSRALLASDQEADALYTEALDRLASSPSSIHLARAELLYGEWLRRRKRRSEARQHLRAAYTRLEEMGAASFAERARLELVATGETARKRSPETRNDLTPQEAQIAELASR
jgi:hypothetical protein